ncbi:hypothetical protein P8452_08012 [Trifolium repens]|nr:hypothetical protein P8452_08012 [Trifolium repens]
MDLETLPCRFRLCLLLRRVCKEKWRNSTNPKICVERKIKNREQERLNIKFEFLVEMLEFQNLSFPGLLCEVDQSKSCSNDSGITPAFFLLSENRGRIERGEKLKYSNLTREPEADGDLA